MALAGREFKTLVTASTRTSILSITGKGVLKSITAISNTYGFSLYIQIDGQTECSLNETEFAKYLGLACMFDKTPTAKNFTSVLGGVNLGDSSKDYRSCKGIFNLPFTTSLVLAGDSLNDITIDYILEV